MELKRRIATYGLIPRSVFALDQEATMETLVGKINSFEFGKNLLHMLSNAELPENKHGLSWWVVNVDATKDLRDVAKITWASDEIFNQVIARIATNRLSELEDYIANTLRAPPQYASPPTAEYQRWAALKIATGVSLYFYRLKESTRKTQKSQKQDRTQPVAEGAITSSNDTAEEDWFPPKEVMPVSSLNDPRTLKILSENRGSIYYSTRSNEPLCDAAAVTTDTLYLFQMTVGRTHRLTKPTLTDYVTLVKNLNEEVTKYAGAKTDGVPNKITKVRVVFVVPHKDTFSLPKSTLAMVPHEDGLDIALVLLELQPRCLSDR